jgi:hypothetical protein
MPAVRILGSRLSSSRLIPKQNIKIKHLDHIDNDDSSMSTTTTNNNNNNTKKAKQTIVKPGLLATPLARARFTAPRRISIVTPPQQRSSAVLTLSDYEDNNSNNSNSNNNNNNAMKHDDDDNDNRSDAESNDDDDDDERVPLDAALSTFDAQVAHHRRRAKQRRERRHRSRYLGLTRRLRQQKSRALPLLFKLT